MKFKITSFFLIMFLANSVFAHGEDKPGPHGGFIQMPGAFHTEVVPVKEGFAVYLLDLDWKNPITKASQVLLQVKPSPIPMMPCSVVDDHFVCRLPKNIGHSKGKLFVQAKRGDLPPVMVEYALPLQRSSETMKMSGHH